MAADKVSDLTLGNYLKIVSRGTVYNNLSEESAVWDMIKKRKKGPAEGRECRFSLRSTYGTAAAGFVTVSGGSYPTAQKSSLTEGLAQYKDFALTVEAERTLIAKAMSDFSRYGEPLAEEIRAKTIALSRHLSRAAMADGTGVLGTVSSTTVSNGELVITLDTSDTARGFVGWFEYGDKINCYNPAGDTDQAPTLSSGTHSYFTVESRNRPNDKVTLASRNSSGTKLTITDANDVGAGDLLYRTLQDDRADLSSFTADYNTASQDYIGLESLTADDGRTVHNITMSGALGGTRRDAGGNPIDSQNFQQVMSDAMVAVGQGRYKYDTALMAWETLDALIESRETDRRFHSVQDNRRGVEGLGYRHGKNDILFQADEWTRKDRIYIPPQGDVLQFYGSDFEYVAPNGSDKFHLKPSSSGGHDRVINAYMEGDGTLICVHSAAVPTIHNFTV